MLKDLMMRVPADLERGKGAPSRGDDPAAPMPARNCPSPVPLRRLTPVVDAGDPRGALWWHLDTWARLKEAEWTQDEVNALYNAIIAFWTDYPDAAEGWWRDWRAAHPEARLC